MELLEAPKLRDHVDAILAFALALVCAGLALLALQQVRILLALMGELSGFIRREFRLLNIVTIIVLGVAWFVYTLWVVHATSKAHTDARVAQARGKPMPARYGGQAVLRWLWAHNLHLAAGKFARNAALPVAVWAVVRIVRLVVQAVLVG